MRVALRKHLISSATGLFVALAATQAVAAPPQQPHTGPKQSSAQFTLRREEAGGSEGIAARNKARAGDCAGALPLFDAAIRNTIEPTLRRDRGLCHEKLSHPYPAIDDYRAYLTARPDANDGDQIRDRLARLEEQTGQGGPSSRQVKDEGTDSAAASADASAGGGSASASLSVSGSGSSAGKRPRDDVRSAKDYDDYVAQEKVADSSETSPLRYGEGWVIGPILQVPRYFFLDGNTSDMAYVVGGRVGYSMSSSVMILGEFGYGGTGESGKTSSTGGPVVQLGAELRIPISRYASDQILLGGGLGFERYVVSGTRYGLNEFPLRFKLGYRHVFGPSIALDLAADGGPVYFKPDDVAGVSLSGRMGGVVGGAAAFLIAF